jgi:hypothetical protein
MSSGDQRGSRVSRREFLGAGAAMATVGMPSIMRAGSQLPARLVHPSLDTAPWGLALVYGDGKLDLIDLDERSEHKRITLPRRPAWMKVLGGLT